MTLLEIGLFFGISFIAAAINSVAGGGTFLTFPVFILNGLTPLQANIMSTIALWPGTLGSIFGYRRMIVNETKRLKVFLIIGMLGGVAGAVLLLKTPEQTFKHLVPWLLLSATLIFTFGRRGIALWRLYAPVKKERTLPGILFQCAIAIYGGYFGAGIGILTLAMLQAMGMSDIHHMNALKTLLTGAINAATVIIFLFSGHVIWTLAFIMIAGAVPGGYLGARMALRVSPEKVRRLVSAIGFGMSAYFFLTPH